MELVCPICERKLWKNESLQVGYDARGTFIVRHMVPAGVAHRTSEEDDTAFYLRIKNAGSLDMNNARSICGRAGFTRFAVSRV